MPELRSRSPSQIILCVDDEEVALKIRCLVLSSAGYDVVSATNADEALELLRTRPIDLVITDHLLGRTTGTELAARIKGHQPHTRIALLSGLGEPPEGSEYADAYLQKGMTVPEFLHAVRALLTKH